MLNIYSSVLLWIAKRIRKSHQQEAQLLLNVSLRLRTDKETN